MAAKKTTAKIAIKYSLRGLVKAKQSGNITLANNLGYTLTYILQALKILAVHRAKDINTHITNHLSCLTNITAACFTEITDAITAYDAIKDNLIIDL